MTTPTGHTYQHLDIGGGARAHLGNSYHVGEFAALKDRSADGILRGHLGLDDRLDRLPVADDAPFSSFSKQHESTCLEDSRVDVLKEIYSWAGGPDERCIFWLRGLAGTGKSTIARTVASIYSGQKCLGASFFFSRGGGDVSHAGKFVTVGIIGCR